MPELERDSSPGASPYLERAALPALHSPEPFTGAEIIREVPPGPAILLCQAYRAVMLWAATPPQEHAELFAPATEGDAWELLPVTPMPDDLRGALEVIRALTADPAGADPRAVAAACLRITGWAQRREAPDTAYRFVQAAGTCAADDARLAYRAGCMARQRSEWYLAKLWFRHAISVGRRTRDWEGHAMGYVALGYSYYRQGKYSAARREQTKALRVAKRHGLREVQGKALHDLFLVAVEMELHQKAEEYGYAAFHAYGATHQAIPALAHDVAYFWNTQGQFSRALPVFRVLLRHFRDPEDHLRVLASVVRAAGGVGSREVFDESWSRACQLVQQVGGKSVEITSLMQLAYGAANLSEWGHAEWAASRARDAAHEQGKSEMVVDARRLLESISVRAAELSDRDCSLELNGQADSFVSDLVSSLEAAAVGD